MKAKYGAIVVDGRGKINGFVASKNRAGNYFRTKTTPVNPQSTDQFAVRNQFGSLAQAWRNLTDAQRASFNAAVEDYQTTNIFGDLKTPSGFNLFMRLNQNLQTAGFTTLDECPPVTSPDVVVMGTVTADESSGTVSVAFSPDVPTGHSLVLEATSQVSPGKTFVKNRYRHIATLPATTTSPYAAGTEYVAKFGALQAGQQIFVRGKLTKADAGLTSTPSVSRTVVVP